jgi:uncharacterized DUF497 family protein
VEFEFDPAKSQANKAKHGIDFKEAQALWQASNFVEYDAIFNDENRVIRIAPLKEELWFCVFTMRGEKNRLISVRRVRPKERELYEQRNY